MSITLEFRKLFLFRQQDLVIKIFLQDDLFKTVLTPEKGHKHLMNSVKLKTFPKLST